MINSAAFYMTVNQLLKKIQKVNIEDVIVEALISTEDDYVKAQREQTKLGFNSLGKRIGQYRNPLYKALKLRLNPAASGYVDLFKRGDFNNAMFARVDNDGFIVGSEDSKSDMLEERYNKNGNIFTLSPINKNEFIKMKLRPNTIKIYIKKLS